jgi:predicted chitinase
MTISAAQLRQIMPRLAEAKLQLYLPSLNSALQTYAIDTPLRCAAFVAQLAHESGEFRWMEEIWGPTAAQLRYEPPSDLARRLGNTEKGDGARFKGRGPIQITGRFNYAKFGELLGLDLCAEPALACAPAVAFATAGLFWQRNGLNELADAQRFVDITRRINGGTNGLADREQYYARAKAVLGVVEVARQMPLERGFEQIALDLARAKRPSARRAPKAGGQARGPKRTARPAKSATKPTAGKTAARPRAAAKKTRPVAARPVARKVAAKNVAATKGPAKKAPSKKVAATKAPAKKAPGKKAPAKKAASARRSAPPRQTPARRPATRKAAARKR